ncbi:hypothetical protein PILCRDRAFT_336732 [Piloderma croceum F 1598]|uniref:Uncharacterized protein n=1 Tax=Piloderma croceum (strain F 1598) TaxID=765440 RepID=A0A0C3BGX1_PILCF|nr:hypothetical protein PILCRDRAFT_336732 [Piloderma croceum F 1598]
MENGGGDKILQKHRRLPNGELSHQNLFEAIADIVTQAQDLVGIQALQIVTGADSIISQLEPTPREILCQCGDRVAPGGKERAVVTHKPAHPVATINATSRNLAVAKTCLGFAYNPVFRRFGRTPIVTFKDSDIQVNQYSSHQQEWFTPMMRSNAISFMLPIPQHHPRRKHSNLQTSPPLQPWALRLSLRHGNQRASPLGWIVEGTESSVPHVFREALHSCTLISRTTVGRNGVL